MKYTVILTEDNGHFKATVAGLPDFDVLAKTRTEALSNVSKAISKLIARSEIIQLEVPTAPKTGSISNDIPWEWFGAFKDDPTWGELFEDIERQRNAN
jgi:predicted RNase H-like HicB family nuclease